MLQPSKTAASTSSAAFIGLTETRLWFYKDIRTLAASDIRPHLNKRLHNCNVNNSGPATASRSVTRTLQRRLQWNNFRQGEGGAALAERIAHISETPSSVTDLACYFLFRATNEPVAKMQTQHWTIPRAANIVLSKKDVFFHHGWCNVLFIKTGHIEVCVQTAVVRTLNEE